MDITRQTALRIYILILITFLFEIIPHSVLAENLDISSFDYIRKFGEPLQLGECPSRYIKVGRGRPVKRGCVHHMNGQKSSSKWPINYSRNMHIKTPEDLLRLLYLCDGKAATYFGLLHKGDCYATELVNKVRFTPKSYVRIYLSYSRPYTDNLVEEKGLNAPYHLYMDKFFLSATTIGSLEAIVLETAYRKKTDVSGIHIGDSNLSMRKVFELMTKATNIPRKIKVIRLSTAHRVMEVKKFSGSETEKVNKILKAYESEIQRTVVNMQHNHTSPHYSYTFKTFVESPRVGRLISDAAPQLIPVDTWENITALEIRLKATLNKGKSVQRKCRKNMTVSVCKQLNAIYRKIKSQVKSVHKSRASWFRQDEEKRTSKYHSALREAKSNAKTFVKIVRAYKKSLRQRKNG